MNLAQLVQQADSVFVLPESVTRLKACIDDESSSIDDVAEIISFDPVKTSEITSFWTFDLVKNIEIQHITFQFTLILF